MGCLFVFVLFVCFVGGLILSLVGCEATVPSSVKASLQHQR